MQSSRRANSQALLELPFEHTSNISSMYVESAAALPQRHLPIRPAFLPSRKSRTDQPLVRVNRVLRTMLVAMCGLSILGYGLDVAASNDVGKLQEQARRLNEQNTELSAQLLRIISFQGIQDSVLGRFGLRVPEQVLIVKEIPPVSAAQFEPQKYHLPLIAGY